MRGVTSQHGTAVGTRKDRRTCDHLVALALQRPRQRLRVADDLLLVGHKLGGEAVLERDSQRRDLVVVGPALQGGEDGKVDGILVRVLRSLCLALLQPLGGLDAPPARTQLAMSALSPTINMQL